jgi:hypothetical protein
VIRKSAIDFLLNICLSLTKESNIPLAVGLSVAAAAILIAGAVVLFFWLRRRKKRGLVVEFEEPDYVKVCANSSPFSVLPTFHYPFLLFVELVSVFPFEFYYIITHLCRSLFNLNLSVNIKSPPKTIISNNSKRIYSMNLFIFKHD